MVGTRSLYVGGLSWNTEVRACWGDGSWYGSGGHESQDGFEL